MPGLNGAVWRVIRLHPTPLHEILLSNEQSCYFELTQIAVHDLIPGRGGTAFLQGNVLFCHNRNHALADTKTAFDFTHLQHKWRSLQVISIDRLLLEILTSNLQMTDPRLVRRDPAGHVRLQGCCGAKQICEVYLSRSFE